MIIRNGNVFTEDGIFKKSDVIITESKIEAVTTDAAQADEDILNAEDCYVVPGLVDIHFHGCNGHDFCEATEEAFQKITHYELTHGITSVCPATMTLSKEELTKICQNASAFAEAQKKDNDQTKGSALAGIHLEGPYFSYEKRGAQNPEFLRDPDIDEVEHLISASNHLVKILSIAPELSGSMEAIAALKDKIVISVAHTTADYDLASEAFKQGASHVTHLFNAMNPFSHRAPGVVGAAFDAPGCDVELICDGIHINPSMVRAVFQLFSDQHVILVSDSMMATGMPDGDYTLGGQAVKVTGNLATLESGTIAGSATNLFDCMRTAVSMGIPLESALRAASINPARSIGIDSHAGSIAAGKDADILILNKDLSIRTIIAKGQKVSMS